MADRADGALVAGLLPLLPPCPPPPLRLAPASAPAPRALRWEEVVRVGVAGAGVVASV